ncbi:MAG: 50S ribosomal protein L13 [Planctomycetota bacterium]
MAKCYMARKGQVPRKWYVVDAREYVLGRLASHIAMVLMGKHKPQYTPHVDVGDFVVVLYCGEVQVTENRREKKMYGHYSGYPGGWHASVMKDVLVEQPELPLLRAVRRMLPKNRLAVKMLKKLKLYAGGEHPHAAQLVEPMPKHLLTRNPASAVKA